MKKVEFNYYKNGGGTYHMDVMDIDFHVEDEVEVIDNIRQISILLNPNEPIIIKENVEWESHKLIIEVLGDDTEKISKYANYLVTSTEFNITEILNTINA